MKWKVYRESYPRDLETEKSGGAGHRLTCPVRLLFYFYVCAGVFRESTGGFLVTESAEEAAFLIIAQLRIRGLNIAVEYMSKFVLCVSVKTVDKRYAACSKPVCEKRGLVCQKIACGSDAEHRREVFCYMAQNIDPLQFGSRTFFR